MDFWLFGFFPLLQQVTETFDIGRGPELNLFWLEAVKRSRNRRAIPGIS